MRFKLNSINFEYMVNVQWRFQQDNPLYDFKLYSQRPEKFKCPAIWPLSKTIHRWERIPGVQQIGNVFYVQHKDIFLFIYIFVDIGKGVNLFLKTWKYLLSITFTHPKTNALTDNFLPAYAKGDTLNRAMSEKIYFLDPFCDGRWIFQGQVYFSFKVFVSFKRDI